MRKCKCRICGAQLNTGDAFRVDNGNKRLYYCNEKEYKDWCEEQQYQHELKDMMYDTICDILGYNTSNTLLFNEWKIWNNLADNEVILTLLQRKKHMITPEVQLLPGTEYCKIKYLSVVIQNSLKNFIFIKKLQHPNTDTTGLVNKIKSMSYDDFLKTKFWRAISEYMKFRYFYKCRFCGSYIDLVTHHKTYKNHGYEYLPDVMSSDLIVVCDKCHKRIHHKCKDEVVLPIPDEGLTSEELFESLLTQQND